MRCLNTDEEAKRWGWREEGFCAYSSIGSTVGLVFALETCSTMRKVVAQNMSSLIQGYIGRRTVQKHVNVAKV